MSECPICLLDLKSPLIAYACGHVVHEACHQSYIEQSSDNSRSSSLKCGICRKKLNPGDIIPIQLDISSVIDTFHQACESSLDPHDRTQINPKLYHNLDILVSPLDDLNQCDLLFMERSREKIPTDDEQSRPKPVEYESIPGGNFLSEGYPYPYAFDLSEISTEESLASSICSMVLDDSERNARLSSIDQTMSLDTCINTLGVELSDLESRLEVINGKCATMGDLIERHETRITVLQSLHQKVQDENDRFILQYRLRSCRQAMQHILLYFAPIMPSGDKSSQVDGPVDVPPTSSKKSSLVLNPQPIQPAQPSPIVQATPARRRKKNKSIYSSSTNIPTLNTSTTHTITPANGTATDTNSSSTPIVVSKTSKKSKPYPKSSTNISNATPTPLKIRKYTDARNKTSVNGGTHHIGNLSTEEIHHHISKMPSLASNAFLNRSQKTLPWIDFKSFQTLTKMYTTCAIDRVISSCQQLSRPIGSTPPDKRISDSTIREFTTQLSNPHHIHTATTHMLMMSSTFINFLTLIAVLFQSASSWYVNNTIRSSIITRDSLQLQLRNTKKEIEKLEAAILVKKEQVAVMKKAVEIRRMRCMAWKEQMMGENVHHNKRQKVTSTLMASGKGGDMTIETSLISSFGGLMSKRMKARLDSMS